MDALTALLDGPKARGALLLKAVLTPPWAVRIEDRAPISVLTMVHQEAWIIPDCGAPVLIRPGDVALLRGPDPYTIADRPDTPVGIVVGPDQRCGTTGGADLTEALCRGVRTWGDTPGPDSAVMLSGTYQAPSEVGRRLLDALPALVVRPRALNRSPLVALLAEEVGRDEPGQELVLDRLLDLLFVGVLRHWLADPTAGCPAWHRAQSDPVVGPALELLHQYPCRAWTVASLADAVGVSRAALARRFGAVVGEPPMTYLAGWRLTLAADLLREPGATVAAVARRVGYGSAFALSTAFKRVRGVSPQQYRAGLEGRTRPAPVPAPPRTLVLGG
ncbi:AraC family transcriptional regulator [Streptomyces sp. NPDC046887]|uniref:AraC family transcriptional regulator n=1 Tax=Streptomyces sp. NPDC046887 TaxID=3155472 RepID=UPI0033F878CA